MMDEYQLNVTQILEHTAKTFGKQRIIDRTSKNEIREQTYAETWKKVQRLSNFLTYELEVEPGDIIGVLDWNTLEFLELYYGIPGIGAVILQLNLRLHPSELVYIANKASVKTLFVGEAVIELANQIIREIKNLKSCVVMGPHEREAEINFDPVYYYNEELKKSKLKFDFPMIDERSGAAMCFTSGTTGRPKGVIYSHRALVLQALTLLQAVALVTKLSYHDIVMNLSLIHI